MNTLFTVNLTINMPNGGRHAKQLLNLYFTDMPVDILSTASHLCNANEAEQARRFARLTLKRADVWASEEHRLEIFALLSVSGEDLNFIEQVFSKYMESFSDFLKKASERYFSSTGFPPGIPLQPTDWNAEVLQA